jgi:hypothetical protein
VVCIRRHLLQSGLKLGERSVSGGEFQHGVRGQAQSRKTLEGGRDSYELHVCWELGGTSFLVPCLR